MVHYVQLLSLVFMYETHNSDPEQPETEQK